MLSGQSRPQDADCGGKMLTNTEKEIIKQCARKYHVTRILLFGSSLRERAANDIDLAVKGINPGLFFEFYADLFKLLPRKVDLVDLDSADKYLARRIIEGGRVIYES